MRSAIAFIILVFLASSTKAQVENPEPQDVECSEGYYLGLPEGSYDNQCILNVENATINGVDSEIPLELRATDAINVYNSDLIPNGGPINLTIGQSANNLEIAWYEPTGTMTVPRYEKVELGIKLPAVIQEGVNAFIEDPSSEGAINPFDPDQLDVYAIFEREEAPDSWVEAKRINGFYFKDYEMNFNLPDYTGTDYGDWDWVHIPTEYDFRIRYAPPHVGRYRCYIYMNSGGETYESIQVEFDVSSSENTGYITTNWTNRFLQKGNGETFYPVGTNLQVYGNQLDFWRNKKCNDEVIQVGDPNLIWHSGSKDWNPWSDWTIHPAAYHHQLYEQLNDVANAGGNMVRTISFPWDFEIEFEKLNNYYDRLHCAWELDEYINLAHELNVKIEWNMMSHYQLEVDQPYGFDHWDWYDNYPAFINDDGVEELPVNKGYCYHTELGLEEPIEFFTEDVAIEMYKKKMRYYIARWGYSTTISMIELLSEINGTGRKSGDYLPWTHELEYREALDDWQYQIAQYIKEDLGHTEHLLASSYLTGGAMAVVGNGPGLLPTPYDFTYLNPYLDVHCESHYTSDLNHFAKAATNYRLYYNKPIVYSEDGFGGKEGGYDVGDCIRPVSNIKYLLLYAFSGVANAGNVWDDHVNPNRDHWSIFGHVKDFMEGIDFNVRDWKSYGMTSESQQVAMAYLRDGNPSGGDFRAAGVIYNMNWNEFSARQCQTYECYEDDKGVEGCDCEALDNGSDGEEFYLNASNTNGTMTLSPSDHHSGQHALIINDMGWNKTYFIRFYDPVSGEYFFSGDHFELQTQGAPLDGDLTNPLTITIPFPLSEEFPIVYFELWDDDLEGFRESEAVLDPFALEDSESMSTQSNTQKKLEVYPNPVSESLHFKILDGAVPTKYFLWNSTKSLVLEGSLDSPSGAIDMSTLPPGAYFLEFILPDERRQRKVIKL